MGRTLAMLVQIATLIVLLAIACTSRDRVAIGSLSKADGVVERAADGAFQPIAVGAKLYRGDRVRTAGGKAQIQLADGSRLELEPQSDVHLVDRDGTLALEVGRGSIVIDGTGTFALEMGQVRLEEGTVLVSARGSAGDGGLQLVVGKGALVDPGGKRWELEVGKIVTLEVGQIVLETIDAGVPDAATVVAPQDAGVADPPPAQATIEITGDGAKVQVANGRWTKLPAGTSELAKGSKVTLGDKTTARITVRGTTLEIASGSRASMNDDLELAIERGAATATIAADDVRPIRVPGGRLEREASTDAGELRIDVDRRGDARIVAVLGGSKLTGKRAGSAIELARGDSGVIRAAGTVAAGDTAITDYFDIAVDATKPAALTLHDPAGATAVRFDFGTACPDGGAIEMDRDTAFRLPRVSFGDRAANLLVRGGSWVYRLRCMVSGSLGPQVTAGRIAVVRDSGTRPLPRDPPRYSIDADGRNYRLHYQSQIPNVIVRSTGQGSSFTLHLVTGATEELFKSTTGTFEIPAATLRERDYTFWVDRDGQKSKVSTLKISFDQTSAQVYIEVPVEGRSWGSEVEIRGATLPGWNASIDKTAIPSDKNTRRFRARIPTPTEARAIAIRLEHAQHGVHLYVRRGKHRDASTP